MAKLTRIGWRMSRTSFARCGDGNGGYADLDMLSCCFECRTHPKHGQRQRLTLCLRVWMVYAFPPCSWKRPGCLHVAVIEEG
jgi:hypothetical protein